MLRINILHTKPSLSRLSVRRKTMVKENDFQKYSHIHVNSPHQQGKREKEM